MTGRNTQSGFTMIELLVALTISVTIVLVTSLVFVQGIRHARIVANESQLVDASAHMIDVLVLYIRPAISMTSAASNSLELTGSDLSTNTFTLNGTDLELNGVAITPSNVEVTYIDFEIIENTVEVEFRLDSAETAPNSTIRPFAGTTTIAIRNQ